MNNTDGASIKHAIEARIQHLRERPELVRSKEKPATATVEGHLRCRLSADGTAVATTDMPPAFGGNASAPTPGWYMRAALAACDATTIAMRAAYVGVALESVEVTVKSESDPRGVVGMTDDAPAGPLQLVTHIRVEAGNNAPSKVQEVVDWALAHSPVADAMARNVPNKVHLEIC
jgi:uncharacterized OsmC-like protein